jgi:hypothetical protein
MNVSEKTTLLKAFNSHFFEFVDDIIAIFPENTDLHNSRISFDMIKRGNPTAIIKAWYKFVFLPYQNVIQEGEISFFFEKDYSNDLAHLSNIDRIMTIIDSLREPVKQMGDLNKGYSMKYIKNLSKLSEMYLVESKLCSS